MAICRVRRHAHSKVHLYPFQRVLVDARVVLVNAQYVVHEVPIRAERVHHEVAVRAVNLYGRLCTQAGGRKSKFLDTKR